MPKVKLPERSLRDILMETFGVPDWLAPSFEEMFTGPVGGLSSVKKGFPETKQVKFWLKELKKKGLKPPRKLDPEIYGRLEVEKTKLQKKMWDAAGDKGIASSPKAQELHKRAGLIGKRLQESRDYDELIQGRRPTRLSYLTEAEEAEGWLEDLIGEMK